jgi:S1-C subfamily serine protease
MRTLEARARRGAAIATVVTILALALASVACSSSKQSSSATGTPASTATLSAPTPAGSQGGSNAASSATPDIAAVVEKVKPTIVQITSQQVELNSFNQPYSVPAGVGSGVIYDSQGHILTNDHVVEGAQSLTVSLTDGRSMDAKLVGADPQTDLAVLKIEGNNLPAAELGSSDGPGVGDWVVAIGNALGLPGGPTVTVGVVSALGRTVQEPSTGGQAGPFLFDLIQTDAAINPGNSGGGLFDLTGRVIGINTLVANQAEPGVPAQGIGFAISISTAGPIAAELVKSGSVSHAYLGITYVPLNPAIAAQLGTTEQHGAVITDVAPGSPAANAGLQRNDIITRVEGKVLDSESALAAALANHKPGDKVTFTVNRGGSTRDATVTLGTAPS